MLVPFQILPDTLFYFQGETTSNNNLHTCMLKQTSFGTNRSEMGVLETPNCARIRKISFLQHLGCGVRSGREDKAVLRQPWEREEAVTRIRWPGIGSRLHHKLVHTSLAWKIILLFFTYQAQ